MRFIALGIIVEVLKIILMTCKLLYKVPDRGKKIIVDYVLFSISHFFGSVRSVHRKPAWQAFLHFAPSFAPPSSHFL